MNRKGSQLNTLFIKWVDAVRECGRATSEVTIRHRTNTATRRVVDDIHLFHQDVRRQSQTGDDEMLTVLGRRSSFNVQKVAWLLAELDVPFRHIELGGSFGGLDTPEFRMMNPHGKVPVLKDGELVIWESHAILRYLAAKHGAGSFWIEDPAGRSRVDQWIEWSQSTLQNNFMNGIFWGFYRTPEDQRDQPAIDRAIAVSSEHFGMLDRMLLENDYLLGDTISLADIPVGAHLYRLFNMGIKWSDWPGLNAYYDRLQQRPGYAEHVMVSFEELFGRLSF